MGSLVTSGITFNSYFFSASEWFLSKLLAYRREFLYVGVLSVSMNGALISWADIILANIATISVCVASDATDMDGMEGTLARQKEDEVMRAASQLPCKLGLISTYPLLIEHRHLV